MRNSVVRSITFNAIVAAAYFGISMATSPFAFLAVQVRIAEALVLLCFFRLDFAFGLTLGCFLTNLFSPLGLVDAGIGSAATLASCLLVYLFKHLALATLVPVVINAFVVGAELHFILQEPFWLSAGLVALGEFIAVSVFGYLLFMYLGRRPGFLQLIGAKKNKNFVL